jgi:hypothetical protein
MNEIVEKILHDGGFLSRKLLFSLFSVIVIFAGWLIAGHFPSLQGLFQTYVGGVVGVAGLYLTGSVATNWTATKAISAVADQGKKPADEG